MIQRITMKRLARGCACVGAALLVAACGGGGGGGSAEPAPQGEQFVPTAASQGITVFAGWLKQLNGESLDGREAFNTSTFTPTVQDDAEPVAAPY